jgi:hypothetical protein
VPLFDVQVQPRELRPELRPALVRIPAPLLNLTQLRSGDHGSCPDGGDGLNDLVCEPFVFGKLLIRSGADAVCQVFVQPFNCRLIVAPATPSEEGEHCNKDSEHPFRPREYTLLRLLGDAAGNDRLILPCPRPAISGVQPNPAPAAESVIVSGALTAVRIRADAQIRVGACTRCFGFSRLVHSFIPSCGG